MSKSKKPAKLHPFRGDMKTVEEIASVLGLTKRAVYFRIERDMPLDELMKRGPKAGTKVKPASSTGTKSGNKQLRFQKPKPLRLAHATHLPAFAKDLPKNFNRRTNLAAIFGGA